MYSVFKRRENHKVHSMGPEKSMEGPWLVLNPMGLAVLSVESLDMFVVD